MTEGVVTKWLKSVGDQVSVGEPLVEVETDKINNEIEAQAEGVLLAILVEAGKAAAVQAPLALIGDPSETVTAPASVPAPVPAAEAPVARAAEAVPANSPPPTAVAVEASGGGEQRLKASPIARRLAEEHGIDLRRLAGSGPGGRIVERDVAAAIATATARPPAAATLPSAAAAGTPLSGMRRAIAERMSRSWTSVPHVTLTVGVDMTEAVALRRRLGEVTGRKVSFTEIVVRAAAMALGAFPYLNASLIDGALVLHEEIHVGVAVALDDGLIVPVIRHAGRKTVSELGEEIRLLAERARQGRLGPDEVTGGTFTITNLGMYGIDSFTPIVNPPESAILGVCRIEERQVVRQGAAAIRSMMNLCLSCDHRIVDGAMAARFLARLRTLLEEPVLMV
jgi:pyruvate dehydrogenase E2 component (dihydrolipoamide acetyltransferase)